MPLLEREIYLAGLFLYWGEGSKHNAALTISNTDPSIIKFFIYWVTKSLLFPKKRLKVQIQPYKNMDTEKELNFWSESLKLPRAQFNRPYIKETLSKRINHKGGFGHGTCQVRAGDVNISNKVLMGLKVIRTV